MSDEATEEKKGKKKKEKKPKKEKPPKEKKPKKEKKAKKGKDAPEGAEGEEGAKKKGPPLLLILIPVFVVLIVGVLAVVFVVLPRLRGKPAEDIEPDDPGAALSAQVENTERAKQGEPRDAEPEPPPDEPAPGSDGTPAPEGLEDEPAPGSDGTPAPEGLEDEPEQKPVDIVVSMTTSESISYFRSLPPEALGLPGESMDEYDIFASEHLILVDDVPCKEFHVYSISGRAGTNSVEGLYLLTQRGARKIYKLDEATNTVTELNWTPPRPEPEPEPVEDGADAETGAEPS